MASKASWGYSKEFMDACRDELVVTMEKISDPRFHHAVATSAGEIVGFCALENLDGEPHELDALFVEPGHMGEGVGRRLVDYAVDFVRRAGGQKMLIQGDPNAESFYLAIGADRIGERPSGSIAGRMLPLFELRVSGRFLLNPPAIENHSANSQ